jgi:hypothetical protein
VAAKSLGLSSGQGQARTMFREGKSVSVISFVNGITRDTRGSKVTVDPHLGRRVIYRSAGQTSETDYLDSICYALNACVRKTGKRFVVSSWPDDQYGKISRNKQWVVVRKLKERFARVPYPNDLPIPEEYFLDRKIVPFADLSPLQRAVISKRLQDRDTVRK